MEDTNPRDFTSEVGHLALCKNFHIILISLQNVDGPQNEYNHVLQLTSITLFAARFFREQMIISQIRIEFEWCWRMQIVDLI